MRVNNELKMTKMFSLLLKELTFIFYLLIHYDVYVPMSWLSSWLQSLPTKRVKQAMICSSYLNRFN